MSKFNLDKLREIAEPRKLSRAEEMALKAYPRDEDRELNFRRTNYRIAYERGYKQAEKDLGWISVKDRLPDTTEYVFTCIKMDGRPQCVGFHYYKDGKWWEGYEEDSVGAVEYWMQIPQFKEAKQ